MSIDSFCKCSDATELSGPAANAFILRFLKQAGSENTYVCRVCGAKWKKQSNLTEASSSVFQQELPTVAEELSKIKLVKVSSNQA